MNYCNAKTSQRPAKDLAECKASSAGPNESGAIWPDLGLTRLAQETTNCLAAGHLSEVAITALFFSMDLETLKIQRHTVRSIVYNAPLADRPQLEVLKPHKHEAFDICASANRTTKEPSARASEPVFPLDAKVARRRRE